MSIFHRNKGKRNEKMIEDERKSDRVIIKTSVEFEILSCPEDDFNYEKGVRFKGDTINLSSGGLLTEKTQDLGAGGLLVETNTDLPNGTKILVGLTLPMPGYSSEFLVEGFVIRSIPNGDLFEIAVTFSKIIKHHFNKIRLDIIKEMFNI